MRPQPPFYCCEKHFALNLPGARALFTTRRGGYSTGPYATLNLGLKTGDDPRVVRANRAALAGRLGQELVSTLQVHGTAIRRTTARKSAVGERRGTTEPSLERPQADGQVTTELGLAPLVLVADCLPIVLGTPGAIAVVHGGWRGLAGGIVEAGIRELRAAGGSGRITAAIGPGAGGCCYDVGEDVHAQFAGYGPRVRHGTRLDLKAVAHMALARADVSEVHDLGVCTICGDPELFYSHRRDGGVTGRQAGLAWLT